MEVGHRQHNTQLSRVGPIQPPPIQARSIPMSMLCCAVLWSTGLGSLTAAVCLSLLRTYPLLKPTRTCGSSPSNQLLLHPTSVKMRVSRTLMDGLNCMGRSVGRSVGRVAGRAGCLSGVSNAVPGSKRAG
ncbi:hypothetical protein LX32DRAFT_13654 [Colletotrichum zoysiae]|uniref:Uncharacterized protein n=1 Tax=Colletotrichum zoysiae TaxID=1216348 RepID=A0AAD9HE80_9PEZI|nr:hypothetical protein LX32DRAFT_13654 [Colletotrichum zoysiae]